MLAEASRVLGCSDRDMWDLETSEDTLGAELCSRHASFGGLDLLPFSHMIEFSYAMKIPELRILQSSKDC